METLLMAPEIVTLKYGHDLRGVAMKITIELEGFAVKCLLALGLAAWCALKGQPEVAATAAALVAAFSR